MAFCINCGLEGHGRYCSQCGSPVPAARTISRNASYCSDCGRLVPVNQLAMIGYVVVCAQCQPRYMDRLGVGSQGGWHYAGFWIRWFARAIDGAIFVIAVWILSILLEIAIGAATPFVGGILLVFIGAMGPARGWGIVFLTIVFGVMTMMAAYEVFFVSIKGATPGKMILGLKIIRSDGSRLRLGGAIGRTLAKWINEFTMNLGYIMAGIDVQKRALHDRLCDTRVIHVR